MADFNYAEFAAAFPWFFPVCATLFGAIVGSFLNVVIYRVPAEKSIVHPGSHCACGKPIAWYDNIPVLSWILLRGKARCCGRPYGIRYPAVELLTALLFLGCWLAFPPSKALAGMFFVSCLICATFIDLDHMIIPDFFTIGLAVIGVTVSLFVPALHEIHHEIGIVAMMRSGLVSLTGMLIGSGLVLWIVLIAETLLRKEAMGFGDIKFVGAIGAFCGWQGAVFAMFGGAIVGTVWMAVAKLWQLATGKKAPIAPKAETSEGEATEDIGFGVHVPFGPMLAIAAAIYFLAAHRWVDAYFADFAALFQ